MGSQDNGLELRGPPRHPTQPARGEGVDRTHEMVRQKQPQLILRPAEAVIVDALNAITS